MTDPITFGRQVHTAIGRPSEASLAPSSRKNAPKAKEIGTVQANSYFKKSFIFDLEMSFCDFFEITFWFITAAVATSKLSTPQEHALPLH